MPTESDIFSRTLFWFRRDLRLEDNHGLWQALTRSVECAAIFIFDTTILQSLHPEDKRVQFIHTCIQKISEELSSKGKKIHVLYGNPEKIIPSICHEWNIEAVFTNIDHEPPAQNRDTTIKNILNERGISFYSFIDQTIFDVATILNKSKLPYQVYTPFKKNWEAQYRTEHSNAFLSENFLHKLVVLNEKYTLIPSLAQIGFIESSYSVAAGSVAAKQVLQQFLSKKIKNYHILRDIPSSNGTSLLSVYNRFGCISVRHLHRCIDQYIQLYPESEGILVWRSELIWREFYFYIFQHFPHAYSETFLPVYKHIAWENNPTWFEAWKTGTTGFPLVDAAMCQLNQTGLMHNRLRMVVASFLTKDLLIDYRWGEAYFAEKLMDFDAAANNGGWQWAASTGCDAQPYFRVFHPVRQSEKFDPEGLFIKQFLPALRQVPAKYIHAPADNAVLMPSFGLALGKDYPLPIVEHAEQRQKAIAMYEQAKAAALPGRVS